MKRKKKIVDNPYRKYYTEWGLKQLLKWMDKKLSDPKIKQNIKDVEKVLLGKEISLMKAEKIALSTLRKAEKRRKDANVKEAVELVQSWADEHCLYLSFDAPDYVRGILYVVNKAVVAERKRCLRVVDSALGNNFTGHVLRQKISKEIERKKYTKWPTAG